MTSIPFVDFPFKRFVAPSLLWTISYKTGFSLSLSLSDSYFAYNRESCYSCHFGCVINVYIVYVAKSRARSSLVRSQGTPGDFFSFGIPHASEESVCTRVVAFFYISNRYIMPIAFNLIAISLPSLCLLFQERRSRIVVRAGTIKIPAP